MWDNSSINALSNGDFYFLHNATTDGNTLDIVYKPVGSGTLKIEFIISPKYETATDTGTTTHTPNTTNNSTNNGTNNRTEPGVPPVFI